MSQIHTLEKFVREHPFAAGMSDEHINLLTGCAKNVHYKAGEFLFKEGESAENFYFIREGKVAMELHAPPKGTVQIDTRSTGETLGWSWMVDPHRWFYDARAVEDVRALAFDAVCLRGKWDSNHELAYEMYRRFVPLMQRSLQATRLQLLDIYGAG
jgi:CRP/FNR family transcriptional regulator, cyclic AMP receptor protein